MPAEPNPEINPTNPDRLDLRQLARVGLALGVSVILSAGFRIFGNRTPQIGEDQGWSTLGLEGEKTDQPAES